MRCKSKSLRLDWVQVGDFVICGCAFGTGAGCVEVDWLPAYAI